MEHPDEFKKLLRQIMSREPKHNYSQEQIKQAVQEMEVFELVGESYVVWLN